MKKTLAAITAGFALAVGAPAQAITVVSANGNGNDVDASFSTSTLLALDVGFRNPNPIEVTFALDAADISRDSFAFNSIVNNLSGALLSSLTIRVSAGAFSTIGSITPTFGTFSFIDGGANNKVLTFSPGEPNALFLGNPFDETSRTDWRIGLFGGLRAGDQVTLLMATPVPEPGTVALMIAGLLGIAAMVRRRRS